ncbi:hypothetical protein B4Q13_22170, partial [Lacticaseibacillus rhamnosus]
DKLTMMDMAVPVPSIFNSELVKKNATKEDPWALNWTKSNVAGGGAYRLESWKPGQEIIYARFDDWKSGKLPMSFPRNVGQIPISYILAYPERLPLAHLPSLDLVQAGRLEFVAPDVERFPCLGLAYDALRAKG